MKHKNANQIAVGGVAVVGMAGRFPNAANVDEFWTNVRGGLESITFFSDQELLQAGVNATHLRALNYVRAKGMLENSDLFDAAFFGFSPRDAEMMDPQRRIFLECAWQALENAGYCAENYEGAIGVFAGAGVNTYLLNNLLPNRELIEKAGNLQTSIQNRTDHLSTRVAYELDLRGPAITVQTACSTSLVAIHLACQSLLNGECDMALAGGVTVSAPIANGYFHQTGDIHSSDGHCRAFDANADGTVDGNGAGIVVLKRLEDAIADGDTIDAIVRGSAINNDGSLKVGYTAPGVRGQVEVIAEAQAVAGVPAETITYVEAHGTGTTLGDPIEIEALTEVFRASTDKRKFCAIGSVKTNIGHLDVAAGVAGLIKTVLALKHRELPPSLHFQRPNESINFEETPFFVNASLRPWAGNCEPLRAGISSFGIGGTNAHVVLEEAPVESSEDSKRPAQLLVLSAKTATALDAGTVNLISHCKTHPDANLADVAYTLQNGRKAFDYRRIAVCRDIVDATSVLETLDHRKVFTGLQEPHERSIVMMFPGQGAQYAGMGAKLYEHEALFRREVDRCLDILQPQLGFDLRQVLFSDEEHAAEASERLKQTIVTQPALFAIEYALAQQWMSWGVLPAAMIGHSIGEYVAACLSGVIDLEDALNLVTLRGRLMQSLPPGAMLVLTIPEDEVQTLLANRELSVASVNAPSLCVVSGPIPAVDELEQELQERGLGSRRLHTSHAFHSAMMDSIVDEFVNEVARVKLHAPRIPYLSNVTGKWITTEEATEPQYWGRHLRECVQFNSGLIELLQDRDRMFLEVGPGRTLTTLLRHHPQKGTNRVVLNSLPHADESGADDVEYMLTTLGRLWLTGVNVEWSGLHEGERRRRVPLPSYPFERQRYWIDPPRLAKKDIETDGKPPARRDDVSEWFYVPSWKRVPNVHVLNEASSNAWLLFEDEVGVSVELARQLRNAGRDVVTVKRGEMFLKLDERAYTLNPSEHADYVALLNELTANGFAPEKILYLWTVTGTAMVAPALSTEELQGRSFYSLVQLAQALGEQSSRQPLDLYVMSDGMQEVTGAESISPDKALALGPCRVIPQEYEHISCRSIDVTIGDNLQRLCQQLIDEAASNESDRIVAYRGQHRWVQTFEPLSLGAAGATAPRLKDGGVYLITGGLGGMALEFSQYLAVEANARLALVGRTPLPARAEWEHYLTTHLESDPTRRKIERVLALEARGTEVLVLAADVADAAQFGAAVEQVRERFGPINGVIHTAGVPGSGLIQLLKHDAAASVLAPKVRGTRVIEQLFAAEPLDFLVLCSSRSSILGGFGQADYCAANAFLDSFAHDFAARTGTSAISINWDAWSEVGMLVNTVERFGLRDSHAQPEISDASHPLIDAPVSETTEQGVYATRVSPGTHWVLDDHRIVGTAIMPGTAYFEMARAALERRSNAPKEANCLEISSAYFLAPLGLRDDETREVRTILEKDGDVYQFRVLGELPSENGGDPVWQDYALGQIGFTEAEPLRRYDLEALRARCGKEEILITDDYEMDPDLGPRWQSLRRVHLGEKELLAELELPEEFADDFAQYKLHPALLDRATGTAKHYLIHEGHYLPMSYKRLRVKQPLPRKIYAHIKFRDDLPHEQTITFDIILMDENGTESVVIDGFSQKRINNTAEPLRALSAARSSSVAALPASDNVGVYQRAMREGILPHEGIEAFKRILSNPLPPQVVVSARDLQTSIAQMGALTTADVMEEIGKLEVAPATTTHARLASLGEYAAARNETERTLVEILQTMLGIEQVGIHDNFFELGGDSVLGIQIIAQAKRAGIHLTPQQIFQHPTVAEMAAIAANGDIKTETPPAAESTEIDLSLTALDESQMNKLIEMISEDETEAEQLAIEATNSSQNGDQKPARQLDFSLFFFAADNLRPGEDKYKLYLEGAKFADRNGFAAVWTPERHFHESGGLYPNPSVLSAALATITDRIQLRAGSVVMPLHHSIRVAEEWAVVDNLSGGRVGISLTSGWIPNDFAFFPERYANKREEMWRGIEEVQRLWRGESITARDGKGNATELRVLPRPIQPELPIWITCSGDPEMFVSAGERGFHILTALLGQSVDEVATKISSYREALAKHGHDPATRQVALMLHTFVGPDLDQVLSKARTPLCNYLKAHVGLIGTMTKSLDIKVGIDQEYVDDLVAFAFERYYQTASLIGTPEKCLPMIERLKQIGVDEVACFIDFGIDTASVFDSLQHLSRLRKLSEQTSEPKHLLASV
ncbi:MAG TPA: MupA/Atu3671 family FMN-dependent luciferase-like monooxygenase [Pyrinomonadaceae bacterium]|nr:MupA/Atu3671 family FMN-dependent luciferase-like monooxygenase [Pyrinomonadaceae bacterium]